MMSNPLLTQFGNKEAAINTSRQSVLSKTTYLFSDIIRLLSDTALDQKIMQAESNSSEDKTGLSVPQLSRNLFSKQSYIPENSKNISTQNGNSKNGILCDSSSEISNIINSINRLSSKADLSTFLDNLLKNSTIGSSVGKELSSSIKAQKVENCKNNDDNSPCLELLELLKDNNSLTLNLNLLNSKGVNLNNDKVLVTKDVDTDNAEINSQINTESKIDKPLSKELEKIASLLFELFGNTNNFSLSGTNNQTNGVGNSLAINNLTDINNATKKVKNLIIDSLELNKTVVLNVNVGNENIKIELSADADNDLQVNKNLTEAQLPNNDVEITNNNPITNIEAEKPANLQSINEQIVSNESLTNASQAEINNILLENSSKEPLVNSESEAGLIKTANDQKFTVKITEQLQNTNPLKEMLLNIAGSDKIDVKFSNFNQKPITKSDIIQPGKIISNEQDVLENLGKVDTTATKSDQNVGENKINVNWKVFNSQNNSSVELVNDTKQSVPKSNYNEKPIIKSKVQRADNIISEHQNRIFENLVNPDNTLTKLDQNIGENKSTDIKTFLNSQNNSSADLIEKVNLPVQKSDGDTGNTKNADTKNTIKNIDAAQLVVEKTKNPDSTNDQKSPSDKNEFIDQRLNINLNSSSDVMAVKNEISENIFRTFGYENKPVKVENLVKEISKLFEGGESKSIVLKLKPETLGKVKVVLDVIDKTVNANIQVENESVKQIVQNNINSLRQTLHLAGLQLSNFNVSLNYNENKENKSFNLKKKISNSRSGDTLSQENNFIITKSMGYNTYDYLV